MVLKTSCFDVNINNLKVKDVKNIQTFFSV